MKEEEENGRMEEGRWRKRMEEEEKQEREDEDGGEGERGRRGRCELCFCAFLWSVRPAGGLSSCGSGAPPV